MSTQTDVLSRFYRSVVNSIPIGVIVANSELVIANANPAIATIFDTDLGDLPGARIHDLFGGNFEPPFAEQLLQQLENIFLTKERLSTEVRLGKGARAGQVVNLTAAPLISHSGTAMGLVMMTEDVTQRRQAEEALRKAHAHLEHRVEERTAELSLSNTLLKREIEERKKTADALHERQRTLHLIISSMPSLMLLIDQQDRVSSFFAPPRFRSLLAAFDLEPEALLAGFLKGAVANGRMPQLERVRATRQMAAYEHSLVLNDEAAHFEVKISPVTDSTDLLVVIDEITERRQAEEALHRRDAILETLTYVSEHLLLDNPDEIIPDLLGRLGRTVGVSRVHVFENHIAQDGSLLTSQRFDWSADPGENAAERPPRGLPYAAGGFGRWAQVLGAGAPLHGLVGEMPIRERTLLQAQGICSVAAVPIFSEEQWYGFLRLDDCAADRRWSSVEIEALKTVAGALGAAITRQRIQTSERVQRALAEALRDTAAALNSTLDLDEVLDRILSNVGRVVPHDGASVVLIEPQSSHVIRQRTYAGGQVQESRLDDAFRITDYPYLQQIAETGRPLIIPDVARYPGWKPGLGSREARTYAGAPIYLDQAITGFLNVDSATPGFFNAKHAERLQAFADQAAIAIRNARLYDQAQALAALEERQRLARELHDGVSQALSSARLIADVLPRLWTQSPERGQEALEQLRQLTQSALAEMRMLLIELRPEALVEAELADLLTRLAQATTSRIGVPVELELDGEFDLHADIRLALYRIAQEALNNVIKHAHARGVLLSLVHTPDAIQLTVCDDGQGFDPETVGPDRFGLRIIRERASAIGASLALDSRPGGGTQVAVTLPNQRGAEET